MSKKAQEHENGGGYASHEEKAVAGWKIWLSHVLAVAWMIFIFYMSAQPGETSGEISDSVSHLFMQIWNVVFFRGWSEAEILHMAEVWDYPIRKLAHMTEFGILALLLYWAFGYYNLPLSGKRGMHLNTRYLCALVVAVLYAATDEFHQLFVPDRAGLFSDVLVDASGAVLALLCVFAISCVLRKYKYRIEIKNRKR